MIRLAILSWEVRCFLNSLFFMNRLNLHLMFVVLVHFIYYEVYVQVFVLTCLQARMLPVQ